MSTVISRAGTNGQHLVLVGDDDGVLIGYLLSCPWGEVDSDRTPLAEVAYRQDLFAGVTGNVLDRALIQAVTNLNPGVAAVIFIDVPQLA